MLVICFFVAIIIENTEINLANGIIERLLLLQINMRIICCLCLIVFLRNEKIFHLIKFPIDKKNKSFYS